MGIKPAATVFRYAGNIAWHQLVGLQSLLKHTFIFLKTTALIRLYHSRRYTSFYTSIYKSHPGMVSISITVQKKELSEKRLEWEIL